MIVIIPDIHGEVGWLRSLRESHTEASEFICLGDYFDGRSETADTPATARYIREWKNEDERLTLLVGNHDMPYWEIYEKVRRGDPVSPHDLKFPCSGFSRREAEAIAVEWDASLWTSLEMAVVRRGWVLSHAGIHPSVFTPKDGENWEVAVRAFAGEAKSAFANLGQCSPDAAVFAAGIARGGFAPVGGLVWLDFQEEFVDEEPFPQIVGHTRSTGPRKVGRSWCLDSGQLSYGLLHEDGRLDIRADDAR